MSHSVTAQSPEHELSFDHEEGAYYRYDERYGDYMYLKQDGTPYKRVVRHTERVEQQAADALQQQIRYRTNAQSAYQATSHEQLTDQFGNLELGTGSYYSHGAQGPYQYTTDERRQHQGRTNEEDEEEEEEDAEGEEDQETIKDAQEEDAELDEEDQIIPAGITYEPKESVTDPDLLKKGVKARGMISGTKGRAERLDPNFKIPQRPDEFFVPGRVIKILWPELAGYRVDNMTIVTAPNKKFKDEKVILKIRWFVVVKAGYKWCTCIPISTYGRRGLERKQLPKREHSIIYSGSSPPNELPGERPQNRGERGMLRPIQVKPKSRQDIMDPKSRINYAKVYTIEHNVKVREFGMVKKNDLRLLLKQWKDVLGDTISESEASSSYDQRSFADPSSPRTSSLTGGYHYGSMGESSQQIEYINHAVSAFDFFPDGEHTASRQISLQVDDRLGVITYDPQGWAEVFNGRTQQTGIVPANHIRLDSNTSYARTSP